MARHPKEYLEKINPKNKLTLRFNSQRTAFQYLIEFNIISYNPFKFILLDLSFRNKIELYDFLYARGIARN